MAMGGRTRNAIVLTGFGEGNTQLRVNGLSFGLDNMIYAANGRSNGDVRSPNDQAGKAVSIRRRDVRFRLAARPGSPRGDVVEAIAGFSQFGLAHDDWGNRFPSWNTIPIRHVVFEQRTLDRNPYLAETSCVASILDMADGGRIFSISPAQARFNRESVAFFNASCGPIHRARWLAARGLSRQCVRVRAFVKPGASPRARTGRRHVCRPARRTGTGVPGRRRIRHFVRSIWRPARMVRSTSSTCTASWSSILSSSRSRRAERSTFAAGTIAGGSGESVPNRSQQLPAGNRA